MFSKDLIACAVVFFSLSLQTSAQAVITPALGVSGTPVSSDAQQPSSSAECGQINIADNINSATPITAAADGTFSATIVNFETGTEGSRQVTALVDPTCTGDSFVSATVSQNGDESPTAVGSQTLTVQLPSDTTCTGGTAGNLCLVSFTTAGGFGNCVVVQQDTAATGSTGGSTGNGNSGSTGNSNAGSTGSGNASPKRDVNAAPNAGNPPPPTPTPTPPAPNTPAQPKPKVQRDFRAINARSNGNVNAVPNAGNPPPPTPTPTPPHPTRQSNGNVNAVPNAGNPPPPTPTPTPPAPKTPAQPKPKVQRDFRAINVRSNGNVNAAPNGNNNAGHPVPPPPTPTPTPVPAPAQPKPNVQRDVRAVGSRAARALRAALDWM
ncbi:hypothetical protein A0H81_07016 [Grifola frondosa]|uniref:Uncharacterized protein n=1 Tax=Grifola frondosa TaxID=5627 RepID=A0A1C7M8P3_GRIFR|nr:hypothetical protein A0H81_07016 [Grifola frondosa]